jgi:tetrapyrrole methylase family protein/MazG family protein
MTRLTVVGLGPAGADLIVPAAMAAIDAATRRFVRTAHHPAVDDLRAVGIEFESFDGVYQREPDLDRVYAAIVDALIGAMEAGSEIVYAVPGSPVVAERTIAMLRERLGDDLTIAPGLSFVDYAWARLGIDPLAGTRLVDGRDFAIDAAGASGPLLIAQCDTAIVLSDVKLALLEVLDPEHEVVVLQRLGRPDESVINVRVADLDRGSFVPDHLTSLFVDTGTAMVAGELARLWAITQRLRAPGGCPWDQKQTHHSLARHLLEESYEVVEAIERLPADAPRAAIGTASDVDPDDYAALADELGDLLFQAMIHSALAAEAGAFTIADVARGIHDKLIRRHPHVFGDLDLDTAEDVVRNWEQIKRSEKSGDAESTGDPESLVAGIATTLPALLLLPKLYRKAVSVGIDPGAAAVERLRAAVEAAEVGEIIAGAAALAWSLDLDPEAEAKAAARRFRDRFERLEQRAASDEVDLAREPRRARELWEQLGPSGS